jgi:hypothetical protein
MHHLTALAIIKNKLASFAALASCAVAVHTATCVVAGNVTACSKHLWSNMTEQYATRTNAASSYLIRVGHLLISAAFRFAATSISLHCTQYWPNRLTLLLLTAVIYEVQYCVCSCSTD